MAHILECSNAGDKFFGVNVPHSHLCFLSRGHNSINYFDITSTLQNDAAVFLQKFCFTIMHILEYHSIMSPLYGQTFLMTIFDIKNIKVSLCSIKYDIAYPLNAEICMRMESKYCWPIYFKTFNGMALNIS